MLELEGLRLKQGNFELKAEFSFVRGRKAAVIGPSGAGKSTLLAAIGGFLVPQAGRILWEGQDITGMRPGKRPVTMLFQQHNLFPHLTLADNVGLGINPRLRLDTAQRAKAREALVRVGLDGFGDRRPGALSGGQQSRAALARVMVQARPLLLLDEPFAALGPALRRDMLDLVSDLVEETNATLMMVTHAPEDVARIADEVIFVDDGRAAAPAAAKTLMENPPPSLRAYL